MSSQIDGTFMELWERSATQDGAPQAGASAKLEVNVIFTNTQGTLAALKMAGYLACNLGARINLVVAQVVPLPFPLTRPPVSVAFTEQRLLDVACQGAQGPLETAVNLYLCRDRGQALLRALKPRSLVVIGGRARWWPTAESRLATMIRSKGHQVIFAALK